MYRDSFCSLKVKPLSDWGELRTTKHQQILHETWDSPAHKERILIRNNSP